MLKPVSNSNFRYLLIVIQGGDIGAKGTRPLELDRPRFTDKDSKGWSTRLTNISCIIGLRTKRNYKSSVTYIYVQRCSGGIRGLHNINLTSMWEHFGDSVYEDNKLGQLA